jgi:hypothetical protein
LRVIKCGIIDSGHVGPTVSINKIFNFANKNMTPHLQIEVRTFHKGKKIGKKYFDENNLAATYPSHFRVLQVYTSLLRRITEKGDKRLFRIDISESGVQTLVQKLK